MVREQHARIRAAQPDTTGRRCADETDPVRHGADKGLGGDGEGLRIPRAHFRAREGRIGALRGAGLCAQGGGVARGGDVVEWAQEGGGRAAQRGSGRRRRRWRGRREEEERGRAGVGGQQPVGAVREAVRGSRRFGFQGRRRDVVGQRPWIPCDMGLSLLKDSCEQSTEESKLAINSWRNGKEGVQIMLIRGLAVLGNS